MVKKDKKHHETGKWTKSPKLPAKTPKNTSEPALPEIISETIVEYLHEVEGESPIDLCWENFIKIHATSIEYVNYEELPLNLMLKNTAYNIVMTGTWPEGKRPYVSKGPLAAKYEFAQAHFHWGENSKGGSDHEIEGLSLPFELHLVFYKVSSGSLEDAKKEEDGIVVFCYMYKIHEDDNAKLKPITDNIKEVTYAYSMKSLTPVPLYELFDPITDDYIVYLGVMKYKAVHGVTFIISRETHYISEAQLSVFRDLKDRHENPMILKKREMQDYNSRNVFVVNPNATILTSVLHSISRRSKGSSNSRGSSKRSQKASSATKKTSSNKKTSSSKRSSSKKKSSTKKKGSARKKGSVKKKGSPQKTGSAKKKGSPKKTGSATKKGSPKKTGSAKKKGSPKKTGSAKKKGSPKKSGSAKKKGSPKKSGSAKNRPKSKK